MALVSSAAITAALSLIGGPLVPLAALATVVLGCLAGAIVVARRRGLDGDGLGAIVELSVVGGLLVAAVVA